MQKTLNLNLRLLVPARNVEKTIFHRHDNNLSQLCHENYRQFILDNSILLSAINFLTDKHRSFLKFLSKTFQRKYPIHLVHNHQILQKALNIESLT